LSANATIDPFSADHINITALNQDEIKSKELVDKFQDFYKNERIQKCSSENVKLKFQYKYLNLK